MGESPPTRSVPTEVPTASAEGLRRLVEARLYRALNYLSIFAFVVIVYGGAVLADWTVFQIMWSLLSDEVAKYPLVALALDYARIGLALLFIVGAVVHGIVSMIYQVKLDLTLTGEE